MAAPCRPERGNRGRRGPSSRPVEPHVLRFPRHDDGDTKELSIVSHLATFSAAFLFTHLGETVVDVHYLKVCKHLVHTYSGRKAKHRAITSNACKTAPISRTLSPHRQPRYTATRDTSLSTVTPGSVSTALHEADEPQLCETHDYIPCGRECTAVDEKECESRADGAHANRRPASHALGGRHGEL